ncbi:hypothetical protein GCM10012275_12480 [Longimycelium tulufanense]|uniref:Uncharacterized protein n=1 Tax=Longimycelium tulufanense TaxID=907463 RepID=A0A8J3CBR9_9PSEU|nr:hypothetical protein [Longimycelium tulufanense]GGM43021.1 hypothetical protein GCM10012275_12480 [Longimycelium tulufanense]
MAEAITDRHVVTALRPFVRATGPVLDAVREARLPGLRDSAPGRAADPARTVARRFLDRVAAIRVPGTAGWAAMTVAQRDRWWLHRVGRATALVAAVPGLGGALSAWLPVRDAAGAAGQGLVLCAIAGEHGLPLPDRVRLLAAVLFERDIDPQLAAGPRGAAGTAGDRSGVAEGRAEEERRTARLTADLAATRRRGARAGVAVIGGAVWKLGRGFWALEDELGKRPQGRLLYQAISMIPLVGFLGAYLAERSAMRRAVKLGRKWIERHGAEAR